MDRKIKSIERGHIYIFYRPSVKKETMEGTENVDDLILILHPYETDKYRFIRTEHQGLPEFVPNGEDYWGFQGYWGVVDKVMDDERRVRQELDAHSIRVGASDPRYLRNARPAGEGVYTIARHGDHAHLAFILEYPQWVSTSKNTISMGQRKTNFLLFLKNPDPTPEPPQEDSTTDPRLAREFREQFNGKRFIPLETARFLDVEGAILLLFAVSQEGIANIDPSLTTESERQESAEIFLDLHIEREKRPVRPLVYGERT